jgi:hypothetical protein
VTDVTIAVFLDVASCSRVEIDRYFREFTASLIILKMEAVGSSETSVCIYQTARCCLPEDSHLYQNKVVETFMNIKNTV